MSKIEFKIAEHIGTLLEDGKITTEINLVEWGSHKPQFDLRRWKSEDGEKTPYKGITLSADELKALRDILNGMEILRDNTKQEREGTT